MDGPFSASAWGSWPTRRSVTADGRHAIDVLPVAGRGRACGSSGRSTACEGRQPRAIRVASGTDAASGLPVVSLYGEHTKPRAEDLEGLDVLVVDLQDAGVRFYTYASTMLLCLEAAAEAGIELVVLDRPNPLGGSRAAGPTRDSAADLPVRPRQHGPGPARSRLDPRRNGALRQRSQRPSRPPDGRFHDGLVALHDLGGHGPALGRRPRPTCGPRRPLSCIRARACSRRRT